MAYGRAFIAIDTPEMQLGVRALQFGRTWTALIVLQVAIAVAALPGAISKAEVLLRLGTVPPATAASRLLKGTLTHAARDRDDLRRATGLMFAVGLLAAAGPARRGLAVDPTEALRNE